MRLNIIEFFRETHHMSVMSHMIFFNKKVIRSIEFEANILFWESNRVKNYEN